MPVTRIAIAERFFRHVPTRPDDGCWEWKGTKTLGGRGYGRIMVWSGSEWYNGYAHRVSYEIHIGPIPLGLTLDHLCKNRSCVNPHHLEPVTLADNIRRSDNYERRRTHCPQGHEYDKANTHTSEATRKRRCRACDRIRHAAKWKAKYHSSDQQEADGQPRHHGL